MALMFSLESNSLQYILIIDGFMWKKSLLMGSFCCIICRKAVKDPNHILQSCQCGIASFRCLISSLLIGQMFGRRSGSSFSIHLLERDQFLWLVELYAILWDIEGVTRCLGVWRRPWCWNLCPKTRSSQLKIIFY